MLQEAGQTFVRLIQAESMLVAAATGGLEVVSRKGEQVQLISLIQLDGDIVTLVDAGYEADKTSLAQHFAKVDAELGRLLASIERLRLALISFLAALLAAINLPGLIDSFEAAAPWLLPQALAASTVVLVPKIRRAVTAPLLRPLVRWLMQSYGRKLLQGALA